VTSRFVTSAANVTKQPLRATRGMRNQLGTTCRATPACGIQQANGAGAQAPRQRPPPSTKGWVFRKTG
jgi:hypothetical protein